MPVIKNWQISHENWKIVATIGWVEGSVAAGRSPLFTTVPESAHSLSLFGSCWWVSFWHWAQIPTVSTHQRQYLPICEPDLRNLPTPPRSGLWAPAFSLKSLLGYLIPRAAMGCLGWCGIESLGYLERQALPFQPTPVLYSDPPLGHHPLGKEWRMKESGSQTTPFFLEGARRG